MLYFEILGGVQVRASDGVHEAGGQAQRVLLQTLLVSEERTVSRGALIDELWGEDEPAGVVNALQAHISRLRKWLRKLESQRTGTRLVSTPQGYRLLLDDARLDATEFCTMVARAGEIGDRDPQRASVLLRSALALWQGPVFGGDHGGLLSGCMSTRYNELRLQALACLFDAELAQDRHALLLSELYEAHSENPLRERFCAQLMIALYRSGRQAEALAVYRRMRDRLADELGIDPTPDLRKLEECILTQAPELVTGPSLVPELSDAHV